MLSQVPTTAIPWTVVSKAYLSMEFPRQDTGGLLFTSLGDLPNPGMEPGSPALQEVSLLTEPSGKSKDDYRYQKITSKEHNNVNHWGNANYNHSRFLI